MFTLPAFMAFDMYRASVGLCMLIHPSRQAMPVLYAACAEFHLTMLAWWIAVS